MAFKLNVREQEQRDEIVANLERAAAELEDAVNLFNDAVRTARHQVIAAVENYNSYLDTARMFVEDVVREAQEEFASKSGSWQDSDRGMSADSWISTWQEIDLTDVDVDIPEDIDYVIHDHGADLLDLPKSAD